MNNQLLTNPNVQEALFEDQLNPDDVKAINFLNKKLVRSQKQIDAAKEKIFKLEGEQLILVHSIKKIKNEK